MAEKGGTKIIVNVTIILILISIGFSGCINNENDENGTKRELNIFHYEIIITSNKNSSPYTLILPVPLISAVYSPDCGKPTDLMSDLEIRTSYGNYSLCETVFGFGLKIESKGNFSLYAHKEYYDPDVEILEKYGFEEISLRSTDEYDAERCVFFNSSEEIQLKIDFKCYGKREGYRDHSFVWGVENTLLKKGWNQYNMLIKYEIE